MKSGLERIFLQDTTNIIHKGKDHFFYYIKIKNCIHQKTLKKKESKDQLQEWKILFFIFSYQTPRFKIY